MYLQIHCLIHAPASTVYCLINNCKCTAWYIYWQVYHLICVPGSPVFCLIRVPAMVYFKYAAWHIPATAIILFLYMYVPESILLHICTWQFSPLNFGLKLIVNCNLLFICEVTPKANNCYTCLYLGILMGHLILSKGFIHGVGKIWSGISGSNV